MLKSSHAAFGRRRPTVTAWRTQHSNPDETNWWFPLSFNILCTISNRWCNIIQKFTWCSYFWGLKWLSLFLFFLLSNIHRGCSGFFMFVCAQNVSEAVWVLCLSVCACPCVYRCVLKLTEGSHAHGSVTWIFCFASGCCGLPRYGELCSCGWGWGGGREGVHSLMGYPGTWRHSPETHGLHTSQPAAFVKMHTSSDIPFQIY